MSSWLPLNRRVPRSLIHSIPITSIYSLNNRFLFWDPQSLSCLYYLWTIGSLLQIVRSILSLNRRVHNPVLLSHVRAGSSCYQVNTMTFEYQIASLVSFSWCRLSKNYCRQSLRREPCRCRSHVLAPDAGLMPNARVASQPERGPRICWSRYDANCWTCSVGTYGSKIRSQHKY